MVERLSTILLALYFLIFGVMAAFEFTQTKVDQQVFQCDMVYWLGFFDQKFDHGKESK